MWFKNPHGWFLICGLSKGDASRNGFHRFLSYKALVLLVGCKISLNKVLVLDFTTCFFCLCMSYTWSAWSVIFFVSYDIMQCQCWKQCKTGAEEKSIAARMYGWKHDWNITGEDFRDCKGSASWILEVEINNSLRMIGQAPLNMVRWKTGSFSLMAFFQCGQCESPSDGNKAARCWSAMWVSYLVLLQKNLRNVPRTVVTSGFYVSDVGFERLFEKLPWGNEDSPNSFLYKKC